MKGLRKKKEKTACMASDLSEIRNELLPLTSLERVLHAIPFYSHNN
jgi:hypothetical protein